MSTVEEILAAAYVLSPEDKWWVVTRLCAVLLSEDRWLPPSLDLAILNQRMAEFDAGLVEAIPASEVRRQMRELLARHEQLREW